MKLYAKTDWGLLEVLALTPDHGIVWARVKYNGALVTCGITTEQLVEVRV